MILSRLNEISGCFKKTVPVSGSFCSNLKFLRIMDLTEWLWGLDVRVNGMRSECFFFFDVWSDNCQSIRCARKLMTNPELLNAFAHDAKRVLSFTTPTKYRDLRSIKINDHFTCTSANVIYCRTCTYCKKIYIGETGWRLGDRFREHLRDVQRNDRDASKPDARHFNLPYHSKQH